MKNYDLNTELTFGKHKGMQLMHVAQEDPGYVNWCCVNLDHFYISESVLESLSGEEIKFVLSNDAKNTLSIKHEKMQQTLVRSSNRFDNADDYCFEESSTFERYAGSYAQEVEGYSDEDIDDIFDSDPSAYWNID